MAVPLIIAHRGNSAMRPENTLLAFREALTVGADLVEMDVQLTKDGQVVVLHDVTVNRTTDGEGSVRDMTLAEVKKLEASFPAKFDSQYKGERIPTLRESLSCSAGKRRCSSRSSASPSRRRTTTASRPRSWPRSSACA